MLKDRTGFSWSTCRVSSKSTWIADYYRNSLKRLLSYPLGIMTRSIGTLLHPYCACPDDNSQQQTSLTSKLNWRLVSSSTACCWWSSSADLSLMSESATAVKMKSIQTELCKLALTLYVFQEVIYFFFWFNNADLTVSTNQFPWHQEKQDEDRVLQIAHVPTTASTIGKIQIWCQGCYYCYASFLY